MGFADAAEVVEKSLREPDAQSTDPSSLGPWLDLGSGGGIPGLVLAHRWPFREAVLLDSNRARARFLARVVEDQGWGDRVRVVADRAEWPAGRRACEGHFPWWWPGRSGRSAVTAECAAPFLRPGGVLIVSEPPFTLTDRRGSTTSAGRRRAWLTVGLEP